MTDAELIEQVRNSLVGIKLSTEEAKEIIAVCQKDDKWVSCEDGLPATGMSYLTYGSHSLPITLYLDGDGWCEVDDSEYLTGVTYWQPLPEKPNED